MIKELFLLCLCSSSASDLDKEHTVPSLIRAIEVRSSQFELIDKSLTLMESLYQTGPWTLYVESYESILKMNK